MLALEVDFLTGRYVAARADDRDQPEWPPHPARLFFALVNAWAENGEDTSEEAALRWLEEQPPPAIRASGFDVRPVVTTYVPPNDARNAQVLPEERRRQARTFPSVTPHDPEVTFVWPESTPTTVVRAALERLSRRTTYLGHSSSLVSLRFVDGPGEPTLVPTEAGETTLRVTAAGQLDALKHSYDVYVEAGIRGTLPCAHQAYAAPGVGEDPPPASVMGEMIVFARGSRGPSLPIEAGPRVASVMRTAVMSAAGDAAPEVITGHRPGGGRSERPHLAFVALPDVAHRHADGHLLGVAAVLPRGLDDGDRAATYRALLDVSHLTLGRAGRLDIVRVGADAMSTGLNASTWSGASARWATVTPIELDSFPDEPFGDEAGDIVTRACERVGLPRPVAVTVGPDSMFSGSPPWHVFARNRSPRSRPRRPLVHAVVEFECAVNGPMLLGAGRYLGLGLMRPFLARRR